MINFYKTLALIILLTSSLHATKFYPENSDDSENSGAHSNSLPISTYYTSEEGLSPELKTERNTLIIGSPFNEEKLQKKQNSITNWKASLKTTKSANDIPNESLNDTPHSPLLIDNDLKNKEEKNQSASEEEGEEEDLFIFEMDE